MSSVVVDRTVGIEGGVEGESGADAGAFNLSFLSDVGTDVVPGKDGLTYVRFWLYPALVDGMGKAVAVYGCAGGLEIGLRVVEQLMPTAVEVLKGQESGEVLEEPLHNLWVFLHVEEFTGGEECPAVGSAPEEGGVVGAGVQPWR